MQAPGSERTLAFQQIVRLQYGVPTTIRKEKVGARTQWQLLPLLLAVVAFFLNAQTATDCMICCPGTRVEPFHSKSFECCYTKIGSLDCCTAESQTCIQGSLEMQLSFFFS